MAPRFANDSHVLFELYNEPVNEIGSDIDRWLSVRTDMQTWVDIVRSCAPHNLILVNGPKYSQLIGPAVTHPVSGNNIVYVSHLYPWNWLRHSPEWHKDQIRTCAAVHPVMMTEWGFGATFDEGTISDYGQPIMDFMEELKIGNTAFCIRMGKENNTFYDDGTLRCGEDQMGGFVKDTLYEKRNDDQPHGAIQPPADLPNLDTENFETNDLRKFPWENSGDESWSTTQQESNSGNFSAQSGSIGGNQTTSLEVTINCASGYITFYRKVSSESGFDHLKFYIDGQEQDDWSGQHDWAEVSFPVDVGIRTFEWTYSKDGSVSNGDDTAWIDDITFPAADKIEPPEIPFTRGVNLTNWLQAPSVQQIQFTKFAKQDLINIKNLGCDVIRLPINLHAMTSGSPDYTIDPLFYSYLDQIIDWAEELELHLILDNHSFEPEVDTNPDIGDILIPVWMQMAQHYKDRTTYVYYEVLNEPHGISDTIWNQIQQQVIDAIRAVDQTHTIIVGPAGWNSYNNLKFMPEYEDDNLIYTFHFYDPFLFTHQGASWTDPSLESLAGVPFPYYAGDIPVCPPELENTWVKDSLANYRDTETVEHIKELIDIAADFQITRNVPLFCGEFGAYMPNSDGKNRLYWYNLVRSCFELKGIAWTMWDYKGDFGLFKYGTEELIDYDLNIPLVQALGFIGRPQKIRPEENGFDLYLDDIGPNIIESSHIPNGFLDFYSQDNPASGDYCIHWTGVQNNTIRFIFAPAKDLSKLVDQGFAIDFWVRCDNPGAKFMMWFKDTKTYEPNDQELSMYYTIDEKIANWNGEWNHLKIPLKEFYRWYPDPIGAFDWSATQLLIIDLKVDDLEGIHFYFDDIRIIDADLPVKVDLSANGDVEVGWIDWKSGGKLNDGNIERRFLNESYFDDDFTIRLIGIDTPGWARVNTSVSLHDLLEDGFKNDGSFDMQIKNLTAGEYIITTYHHDARGEIENYDGTINITVSDADGPRVVADHLQQSWGEVPTTVASATFTFVSNGIDDVVITFEDNNDGITNEAHLNGFQLDLSE
jgi:endoglucanase